MGSFTRVGTEFTVNTITTGTQTAPQVTALTNGNFAVIWVDQNGDGSSFGIRAQIVDASGAKVGSEFLVNTATSGSQVFPDVAALTGGGFVASWGDQNREPSPNTGSDGITGQIFSSAGAKVGADFLVNTTQPGLQNNVQLQGLPGGGFIAVWRDVSGTVDTDQGGIRARIYDSTGAALAPDFMVNTNTVNVQGNPHPIVLASGNIVVAWDSNSGDSSGAGVKAQILDSTGAKIGSEFLVNTTEAGEQGDFEIAALPGGGFVVTWSDYSGAV